MNGVRGAAALTTVVVLGLGLGACTQNASRAEGAKALPTSNASASLSASPTGVDGEAIAVYRAMWKDAAEASLTSDPKSPRLADHAEGGALGLLQYMMEQIRDKGATSRGEASVAPTVVKSTKNKVELRDCVDGSKWVQVKPDHPSDGTPGGHYRTEASVVLSSGKWKVSELSWGRPVHA